MPKTEPATPAPRTTRKLIGLAVPTVLGGLSALHLAWGLGSHWPADSERALALRVLDATEMPPAAASLSVALALLGAAVIARSVAGGDTTEKVRRLALGLSAVLLVRGVAFVPMDLAEGLSEPFARWDLSLYSPLCIALGAGTLFLARRT